MADDASATTAFYDHDSERAALTALATASQLDPGAACSSLEASGLAETDFHLLAHQELFVAIADVVRRREPADTVTLRSGLAKTTHVPTELVNSVCLDAGVTGINGLKAYAGVLRDLASRRHMYSLLRDAVHRLGDRRQGVGEIANYIAGAQAVRARQHPVRSVSDLLTTAAQRMQEVSDGVIQPVIQSGIPALDGVIGGLQPTLTLVGALPGVGKSAFLATIAQLLAMRGVRTGVVSLEDEPTWLTYRMLSHESGVDQFVMRFRRLTDLQHQSVGEGYSRLQTYGGNILTVDGSEEGMTLDQVIASCHDMILNHGVKAIILDHIGEIVATTAGDRFDLEVSRQLSRLRGIANRYGVPVVVAMHLRRRDGLGPGNVPRLSDFANSSGAERKARVALCLSREVDSDTLNVHVLKNTNGQAGQTVQLKFVGAAAMVQQMGDRHHVRRSA